MKYVKVYIKSADDLPKESGNYFGGVKDGSKSTFFFDLHDDMWDKSILQDFDYYLQPISDTELIVPSEDQIQEFANEYEKEYQKGCNTPEASFFGVYVNEDFVAGFDKAISEIKKLNSK